MLRIEASGGSQRTKTVVLEPWALTAVLLVAAVGTVLKPVTPEAANDAMNAAGTWEEGRATLRFSFGCRGTKRQRVRHQDNASSGAL